MKKRVYNKTIGKIFRTLAFMLIMVASVFFATHLILDNDQLPFISTLTPFALMINDIIATMPFIMDYAALALVIGLIILLWVIRRGLILRVLLSALLLFVFVEGLVTGFTPLVPIDTLSSPDWLNAVLRFIEGPFNALTAINTFIIPGVALALPFLLWMLFAQKKPNRLSIFSLRLGSVMLFLAILLYVVGNIIDSSLTELSIFGTIKTLLYIITYLLFMLGSVLGILGFARK